MKQRSRWLCGSFIERWLLQLLWTAEHYTRHWHCGDIWQNVC